MDCLLQAYFGYIDFDVFGRNTNIEHSRGHNIFVIEFDSSWYQIFVISLICISAEIPAYSAVLIAAAWHCCTVLVVAMHTVGHCEISAMLLCAAPWPLGLVDSGMGGCPWCCLITDVVVVVWHCSHWFVMAHVWLVIVVACAAPGLLGLIGNGSGGCCWCPLITMVGWCTGCDGWWWCAEELCEQHHVLMHDTRALVPGWQCEGGGVASSPWLGWWCAIVVVGGSWPGGSTGSALCASVWCGAFPGHRG